MTATLTSPPASVAVPAEVRRPPMARLVAVELRKTVDTRAGRWLLGIIVLSAVAMTIVHLFVTDAPGLTFAGFFSIANLPISLLLPVLGILAFTSEWSQRTALTTFTLVPVRGRVVTAKLIAVALLAVLSVVVARITAAAGMLTADVLGEAQPVWGLEARETGEAMVFQLGGVLMGSAFGMLLLSSAAALVLYYLIPTLWTVLSQTVTALREPARWLDTSQTLNALLNPTALNGQGWAQLGTSMALWFLLPFVLGLVRVLRREVT